MNTYIFKQSFFGLRILALATEILFKFYLHSKVF